MTGEDTGTILIARSADGEYHHGTSHVYYQRDRDQLVLAVVRHSTIVGELRVSLKDVPALQAAISKTLEDESRRLSAKAEQLKAAAR